MSKALDAQMAEEGVRHLRAADPVLRQVIDAAGPFRLRPQRDGFLMLTRSIISQQISTSAADSIQKRVAALLAPGRLTAEAMHLQTPEQLRGAGVSPQKCGYLLDLARQVKEKQVRLKGLSRRTDEEVIQELVKVKGIGVWTAQMFLMFSLGRPDVFPHDDLGIRSALRNLYGLPGLPDRETSHAIAQPWRPYATIASWYCWRSLELDKARRQEEKQAAASGRARRAKP